jgi:hypothetical protein
MWSVGSLLHSSLPPSQTLPPTSLTTSLTVASDSIPPSVSRSFRIPLPHFLTLLPHPLSLFLTGPVRPGCPTHPASPLRAAHASPDRHQGAGKGRARADPAAGTPPPSSCALHGAECGGCCAEERIDTISPGCKAFQGVPHISHYTYRGSPV